MITRPRSRHAAAVVCLLVTVALLAVLGRDIAPHAVVPVPPSATPAAAKQAQREWRFESAALMPTDPNIIGRDLRAALLLPDGGWLLSVDDRTPRCLAFDSWSCGMLVKSGTTLVRLDANGAVVAQRKDALAIYRGEVFASRRVAVVQYGSLYAIDLETLATVGSLPTPNLWMTRAGDRLYTWETYRRESGATDLVERDPATFAELARYPQITLDGLFGDPIVLPDHNAFAYTESVGVERFAVRVLPLDPTRPTDAPWLTGACGVERVAEGRVAVSRGIHCTNGDTDRILELRATADGRLLASAQGGYTSRWGASVLLVDGDHLIDPVTGTRMPDVPGWPVAVSDSRAITRLGDGGVALLRLAPAAAVARSRPAIVGQATCTWPDFAHVAIARAEDIRCAELVPVAGARRVVLSLGRQPSATSLSIEGVDVDQDRRVVTIHYTQSTTSRWAGATAQVAIMELPEAISGEWLVWLVTPGATPGYGTGPAFQITLP